MAEIKIYGTLKNDTGEAIAYADQIYDPKLGMTVSEALQSQQGKTDVECVDEEGMKEFINMFGK